MRSQSVAAPAGSVCAFRRLVTTKSIFATNAEIFVDRNFEKNESDEGRESVSDENVMMSLAGGEGKRKGAGSRDLGDFSPFWRNLPKFSPSCENFLRLSEKSMKNHETEVPSIKFSKFRQNFENF